MDNKFWKCFPIFKNRFVIGDKIIFIFEKDEGVWSLSTIFGGNSVDDVIGTGLFNTPAGFVSLSVIWSFSLKGFGASLLWPSLLLLKLLGSSFI